MVDYDAANYPPSEVQAEFFRYALAEGAELPEVTRRLTGPLYSDFLSIMELTNTALNAIDSNFTPEYIMPDAYQSPEVRGALIARPIEVRWQLRKLAEARLGQLEELGASKNATALSEQQLSETLLEVPQYCPQVDGWKDYRTMKSCTNACFRMVFGGVSGWTPEQTPLSNELVDRYGTVVVDDVVYTNIYHTEIFKEICQREVVNLEIVGADFQAIDKIVSKIKLKHPQASAYCTINLSSNSGDRAIWHSVVLLGTEGKSVVFHDPGVANGGAFHKLSYADFARRWAVTYNRAQLTIAV